MNENAKKQKKIIMNDLIFEYCWMKSRIWVVRQVRYITHWCWKKFFFDSDVIGRAVETFIREHYEEVKCKVKKIHKGASDGVLETSS